MESLEKALARERNIKVVKKVSVKSLNDIRRVVAEFDPQANRSKNETITSAKISVDGVEHAVAVGTTSKSRRDTIVEGLLAIKKLHELTDQAQSASPLKQIKTGAFEGLGIDMLIKEWFDAVRVDQLICWTIDDSIYKYDIHKHKLTKSNAKDPTA